MEYRKFGRLDWVISEIGYGMWGLAEWKGTDMAEVVRALDYSVDLGCNFFDTAWAYGDGLSEQILRDLLKRRPEKTLYFATKIPPKNRQWPSSANTPLAAVFPKKYIIEYTEKSLTNIGVECLQLQQFHVWEDEWSKNDEWQEAITQLKQQGKIAHCGISVNRWEPDNVLNTLRTDLIDAVQVIYNIFDQSPEDELFPLCREMNIGVIARVPFDEGTLTGNLTKETTFEEGDWRGTYFVPENLIASVDRANAIKPLIPEKLTMAELALRFILQSEDVHTIIPGMRKLKNVRSNMLTSDGHKIEKKLYEKLKSHRWDRLPTSWSQ